MPWDLSSDRPIYAQIMEKITLRIVSGFYPAGEKLPSVRELAQEAGVNPNTMQKAFMELERGGLIQTLRTSGRVVTEDQDMIKRAKESIAETEINAFLSKMKELGFDAKESIQLTQKVVKEEQA